MARHQLSPEIDPRELPLEGDSELAGEPAPWPPSDAIAYDDLDDLASDSPLDFADEHMARLGLTLDFSPGDLNCNRGGELSPAQIARLERDLRLFYWPMSAALVVLALLVALMAAPGAGMAGIFLPLILMALAVIPALLLRAERERLPDRVPRYTTLRLGGLGLTVRRWGLNDDSALPVDGGKPIFAPKHVYKVLRANQTYLVYYVPVRTWRGYRLLSLAPHSGPHDRAAAKPKRKAKRIPW